MRKGLCMESSICACECDKDCEYLKDCEPMKVLVDDVVPTSDEIKDTAESPSIHPGNRINYWLFTVALSSIAHLLLLMAIIVKYYMKQELTHPFLLSY